MPASWPPKWCWSAGAWKRTRAAGCIWISGAIGGLAETEGEAIRYRITAGNGAIGPVVLAGPSCDGVDIMYEKTPYHLPLDLAAGDRVLIHDAGAYVTSYASQNFNGFAAAGRALSVGLQPRSY